jgi:vitamin B12/bleomycin/antimicrobial peptide transport system ATP-binding/permease protein
MNHYWWGLPPRNRQISFSRFPIPAWLAVITTMKPLRFLLPLSFLGTASFGFGLFDPVAMAKQKQQQQQPIGASRAPPRLHDSNYYARYVPPQGKTQLSADGAADDAADYNDDGLIKDSSKTTGMMTIGSSNNADDNDPSFSWSRVSMQFGLFRQMAFPYYRESSASRWLLAGLLVLTLANSGVSVLFSYLGKDFWNALSAKNVDEFYTVLYKYIGALAVGAPLVTMYSYQRAQLKVHWREWMTNRTLSLYVNNKVYYKLDDAIDNPDQRMAEDIRSFTGYSLDLLITVLTSIIDLCSFSLILYSIYPQLFVAIVLYAALGTFITTLLGKVLVNLNFRQLRREADLRYSLVRLRDNAESIAFYGGEDLERRNIKDRLAKAVDNKRKMNAAERNLEFFTNAYRYLVQILPIAVVAPQYFAGAIELGVISQSAGAFSHILSDLSIIINQFEALSTFSAGIERLSGFFESVRNVDVHRNETFGLLDQGNKTAAMDDVNDHYYAVNGKDIVAGQIVLQTWNATLPNRPVLSISHLDLVTPDFKRELIRDLSITVETNLLIVGSSGGKMIQNERAVAKQQQNTCF